MTITLNGEKQTFPAPLPLPSLLQSLGLEGKPVVVEHNRLALLPRELAATTINDGDEVEIVQITAGG